MSDPDPACNPIILVFVSVIFLFLNVILSLGEEAFTTLPDNRLRELEDEGNRKFRRVRHMLENERRFSQRVRLGMLLNSLLATASLIYCFAGSLSRWINTESRNNNATWLTDIGTYLVLVLLAVLCLSVLGSRLPRRLALKNPEKTADAVSDLFSVIYGALRPLDAFCRIITYPLLRLSGINPHENPDKVTEDDIRELMDAGEEIGAIEGSQADMVNNIFEFDDITAAEIMTPRIDVSAVEVDDSVTEALRIALENGYSRIPVFEQDIDHIIGILYIKDLLPYVGQPLPADATIRHLLRDTHVVPDSKKCDELFEEMNEKHLQMSIVVDEYGGVAGIVTMEDLLESIVGNMQDEFDDEEEEVTQLDEHSFEVDGARSIGELEELLDTEISDRDYDTIAGFLMDQLGHIPEENERATVTYGHAEFTVLKMDDRRIEQVLVRILPEENENNNEEN